jgi:PRC-barrel domain
VQFATVPADAALSHSIIGLKVYNAVYGAADEKVGEIKDLVIAKDTLDGYIRRRISRRPHVTPESISITYDRAKKKWMALINTTKEQLKGAPEFKYEGRWK